MGNGRECKLEWKRCWWQESKPEEPDVLEKAVVLRVVGEFLTSALLEEKSLKTLRGAF